MLRVLSQPKETHDDLESDHHDDRDLEDEHASIPRDVEHQHQRFLNALQLALERRIAIAEVKLRTQVVVDAIHRRVVPSGVRLVEEVKNRQDFSARRDALADETVQRADAVGDGSAALEQIDELARALKEIVND